MAWERGELWEYGGGEGAILMLHHACSLPGLLDIMPSQCGASNEGTACPEHLTRNPQSNNDRDRDRETFLCNAG